MEHRPDVVLGHGPILGDLGTGERSSMAAQAASQALTAQRIARISSGPLTARAFSVTSSPGAIPKPAASSAQWAWSMGLSTASRVSPGACSARIAFTSAAKDGGRVADLVAPVEVEEIRARAPFAHQRVELRQERRDRVVPDHHVAVSTEEHGPEWVVRVPELHVRGVGGVADVQGIEHQEPCEIALDHMGGEPLPPVAAHGLEVRQRQPRRFPLAERQRRRADLHPVSVVRSAIPEPRALARVDLAPFAVVVFHGRRILFPSRNAARLARPVSCQKTTPDVRFLRPRRCFSPPPPAHNVLP